MGNLLSIPSRQDSYRARTSDFYFHYRTLPKSMKNRIRENYVVGTTNHPGRQVHLQLV